MSDDCDKNGVSFASARVGFATVYCDAGGRTSTVQATAAASGMASSSHLLEAMMAPSLTLRCSRPQRPAAWSWR